MSDFTQLHFMLPSNTNHIRHNPLSVLEWYTLLELLPTVDILDHLCVALV